MTRRVWRLSGVIELNGQNHFMRDLINSVRSTWSHGRGVAH